MMRHVPFSKEYGCLQMSHVFFLLCASHVFKLWVNEQTIRLYMPQCVMNGTHQS